jgi:putative membrane-bound dehydrogenase-like protein
MPATHFRGQALRRTAQITPCIIKTASLAWGLGLLCATAIARDAAIAVPVPSDDRLQVELVAAEPQIVTPIGIAIDQRKRLFVVESHTHHRPADYKGPVDDLVKVFHDTNNDGVPDTPKVFAEGFKSAMNLALSPSDELYLVHRSGVVILHDADGDGVCERRTPVVELLTTEQYPHNGLSGITFSRDGWLYLGMGENFGAEYTLRGTDGWSIRTGPGRGGKVFRCRANGSELEEVAAGFWNPFGLELDRANRLFCVDNDPGGRPPCRLLHVVPGGDYGYKRRYDDTNAFNGWDGELPGTLPMLAGVGESPCGILSCDRVALPDGYGGALLVASWGDAAIEIYRLQAQGASFRATKENLVAGERKFNEAFCPVDMAVAPDGSLYITDWADRTSYPVHGKGRIWRVSAKPGITVAKPAHASPLAETGKEALRMRQLLNNEPAVAFEEMKTALADTDPFIRAAAITSLAKPAAREVLARAAKEADPKVRLGAMVAQWRSQSRDAKEILREALRDSEEHIRFLALWWAGEDCVAELADELRNAVALRPSPALFQAYITAAELLAVSKSEAPQAGATAPAKMKTNVVARQQLLAQVLHDDTFPPAIHAMAAATVTSLSDAKTANRLLHFAREGDALLRREAVRTLGGCPLPEVPEVLKSIALEASLPAELRADAIVSLARRDPSQLPALASLLNDKEPAVQLETARALRIVAHEAEVSSRMQEKLASLRDRSSGLAQQLLFALKPDAAAQEASKRPATEAEWSLAAGGEGDAKSGERLFLHPLTGCTNCHQAQGRGTSIGPDLSQVARSLDRKRLIESILAPSREIAPQYEHHLVTTKAGAVYSGVLVHIGLDGAPLINALGAGRLRVPIAQVARHDTSTVSFMPAGLENTMTVQDLRDLLAYLLSLK